MEEEGSGCGDHIHSTMPLQDRASSIASFMNKLQYQAPPTTATPSTLPVAASTFLQVTSPLPVAKNNYITMTSPFPVSKNSFRPVTPPLPALVSPPLCSTMLQEPKSPVPMSEWEGAGLDWEGVESEWGVKGRGVETKMTQELESPIEDAVTEVSPPTAVPFHRSNMVS